MKLLIVIVNYRSGPLVIDCLASLAPQMADCPDARVTVTDNASGDDSAQRIQAAIAANGWAWASLMLLDRNGGYAYGNNGAIALALAGNNPPELFLLLNPDTLARPNAIAALVGFMDEHPDVGIAGSRLQDREGTPQRSAFRFPSILGELEGGLRLGLATRLLRRWVVAPPARDEAHATDWVCGASMIVRRGVFEQSILLDEKYFMYFEEVDFCRRAAQAGWSCWYVPASRVVHLVGAVSRVSNGRQHDGRRPAYWFESRRRYFLKNHGRLYAALADLALLAGFSLWRMRRFVQRKQDTDPPKMLRDSIAHSVFFKGWAS